VGIRDYLSDLTDSGAIRRAIGRAFRHKRRRGDVKVRVLVVVDDEPYRNDIVATLGRGDYAVSVAHGSEQALDICRSHDPDVVLVDATLTDREGSSLLLRMRRQWPELTTVAIVHAAVEPSEGATVTGADATLHGPIDATNLLDTIERAIGEG